MSTLKIGIIDMMCIRKEFNNDKVVFPIEID